MHFVFRVAPPCLLTPIDMPVCLHMSSSTALTAEMVIKLKAEQRAEKAEAIAEAVAAADQTNRQGSDGLRGNEKEALEQGVMDLRISVDEMPTPQRMGVHRRRKSASHGRRGSRLSSASKARSMSALPDHRARRIQLIMLGDGFLPLTPSHSCILTLS